MASGPLPNAGSPPNRDITHGSSIATTVAIEQAAISEIATVAAKDADIKAWFEAGKGALPMPNIPAMNSVWGPLGQATADIIAQKATAADRLKAAQTEIEANIVKAG